MQLESSRMLRIDLDGSVWLKPGAAIAYRGKLAFERLPTLTARSLSGAALRELSPLVRAHGKGRLYCAQHGAHVHLLRLTGETLFVAWPDLLAFDAALEFEPTFVAHRLGVAAGGLVAVAISGHGSIALATHGEPLTLPVSPDDPVSTDPHATLAWSGTLTPALKTDLSWRSLVGHGGHEPVQMFFDGNGYVLVQPSEDASRISLQLNPLNRLKALITG